MQVSSASLKAIDRDIGVRPPSTLPGAPVAERGNIVASLQSVSKQYGPHKALRGISIELRAGEVVALLGKNGAGKTTSIRVLLGLTRADSGRVNLFGSTPDDRAARVRVGVMLQVGMAGIPEHLTVLEHIDLFRSYYPAPLGVADIIATAGLAGLEQRRFGKLSGGQQQRVLFALAICGDPKLLFLDEPTVGLDVDSRRLMWAHIKSFAARGKTVLLTTHYIEEADELADRILVIQNGEVTNDGTPEDIKMTMGTRTIRCRTALDAGFIRAISSVVSVRLDGGTSLICARETDAVVRELLLHDPALRDLEVINVALEDAFVALTSAASVQAAQAASTH